MPPAHECGRRRANKSGELSRAQENQPKLAVIITCYNYEQFVSRAISSVLDQHRDDCELVIVDDGSTDNSWSVISSFPVKAFRIDNRGQRAACIFGLRHTSSPFILFLDADDELNPGALETILRNLDPTVSKLQFSLTRISASGKAISAARLHVDEFRGSDSIKRGILRTAVYQTPPTSGNVFRRDVCKLLDEADYDSAVDGVILFAAPFLGDIVSLSAELGSYRLHDRNDSGMNRSLDPALLARDLHRFVLRIEHLRSVLASVGSAKDLIDPRDTFFFYERSLCLSIATGHRPVWRDMLRLMKRLWQQSNDLKSKLAMTCFYALMFLPTARARPLLEYRFQIGNRSAWGFLQALARVIIGDFDKHTDAPA